MKIKTVLQWISLWPPYLGAGIRVDYFSPSISRIEVVMKQRRRNMNYMGTHFGGNLYSMCDPWYVFILIHHLGAEYNIWDKSAKIEFIQPGKGQMRAEFFIPQEQITALRKRAKDGEKLLPRFKTKIYDEDGNVVAIVEKEIYIRKQRK